jgi:hypothetical protein
MYQCQLAPHQLDFYRALLAPFADHELSEVPARGSKKTLTYLDKRSLSNRLDSVCGPHGWDVEYKETNRGYKARVGILCPMTASGTWIWHYKEDDAGFEEMGSKNRDTGEFEPDVDNDEKSGYTNAFRRAAQDAWGIGRYLYKKGIPTFLDPNASAPVAAPAKPAFNAPPVTSGNGTPAAAPPPDVRDPQPPVDTRAVPARPLAEETAQALAAEATAFGQRIAAESATKPSFDNFKIPPPGRATFAWAKEMERVFETKFVDGMGQKGEERGYGRVFADWTAPQVAEIVTDVIGFIKKLPTYKGQFDHIQTEQPGVGPVTQPVAAQLGVNLSELRRELMTNIQALVEKQTGNKAEPAQLKSALQKIAPECANAEGHTGEVPESLSKCSDVVWIRNMVQFVQNQEV